MIGGWRATLVAGLTLYAAGCAPAPAPLVSPTAPPPPTPRPAATVAPTATSASGSTIEAGEQYFYPPKLSVPVGTRVLWRDVQGTHDVVAYNGAFASAVMFEGGTYSFTFTQPGKYLYVCTLHEGAGMWAEVDVEMPSP